MHTDKNWISSVWLYGEQVRVKPGFHYPTSSITLDGRVFPLAELTARVDGWPVSITRQHGPCWRVMETGHPSTQAVNSGSGNWALVVDRGLK